MRLALGRLLLGGLTVVGLLGCATGHWTDALAAPPAVAREHDTLRPTGVRGAGECWSPRGLERMGTTRALALCLAARGVIERPDAMRVGRSGEVFVVWFQRQDGSRFRVFTRRQVEQAMAPVDSPGTALALLALLARGDQMPRMLDPLAEDPAVSARRQGWRPTTDDIVLRVTATDDGWRVHWPVYRTFGCEHDLRMGVFQIGRDGRAELLDASRGIADEDRGVCVD